MPPELLPRALLGAVVGFPALFLDTVGLIVAPLTPPPAPRITIFHHMLDTSSKSYPRGCRGISCPCFGHGWTHCCAFDPPPAPRITIFHHMLDTSSKSSPRRCRWISCPFLGTCSDSSLHLRPPTSPDDSVFCIRLGPCVQSCWQTFRAMLYPLGWCASFASDLAPLGPNLPSNSPADLCEEMLRRCFAKRVQSGGACLVLLLKPCVRLADLCQGSMLKIQDQRRSLLKTLRGHRPPEVFGRGWQRQAQTTRRAKAGRGRGRQQIKAGFLLIWGLAGLGQAWLWLGAWFGDWFGAWLGLGLAELGWLVVFCC